MGYLDRWIQLAEIQQTFQALKELMVCEQFLHASEDHLALYLRERASRELPKLVELADLYLDAQLHRPKLVKKFNQSYQKGHSSARSDQPRLDEQKRDVGSHQSGGGQTQSERVCYSCGQAWSPSKGLQAKVKKFRQGQSNQFCLIVSGGIRE